MQTQKQNLFWVSCQFIISGFLWSEWLQQDMSNITVFLVRKVQTYDVAIFAIATTILLA